MSKFAISVEMEEVAVLTSAHNFVNIWVTDKMLINLKFTRKRLNFEYKTILIGYLDQKL
jgi:hypothetical protein